MSKELTQYQFQEQLMDVHLGSVEVRVKSMACLRNHDAAQRATIQQQVDELRTFRERYVHQDLLFQAQDTIQQLEADCGAWKRIAEDWTKDADLSQQPDDFYEGYSEKQMRAMQALLTQAQARIVQLETEVDQHAWKTSPATAQATIDQLVKQNDQLEAQVKELEADRAIKHNGLRVLAQAVTIHLRVVKTHDDGEALSLAKHILDKPNEPTTTPWLVEMMNQGQVVKQLEAQVKELEEESRQWEKGSLVALLRENKALKALVVQLQGEA